MFTFTFTFTFTYHSSFETNGTYSDSQTGENNFFYIFSSQETVWNATWEFVRYGIGREMGVMLRHKLATQCQICHVLVCFKKFCQLYFCQILLEFAFGKVIAKIKSVNFFWDSVHTGTVVCVCVWGGGGGGGADSNERPPDAHSNVVYDCTAELVWVCHRSGEML